ncbi:MAG TPA: hypothetical protein VG652_04130 [Gaiellaceae bacterium]|nr:hypothetical protein [Gaiellaceae bacterium]
MGRLLGMRLLLVAVAMLALAVPAAQARTSAGVVDGPANAMAKAVAAHQYDTVWNDIYAPYQKVISKARWVACQKQNPVIPAGIKITRIGVAQTNRIPSVVPQLGLTHIQDVQVQIVFTRPPDTTLQAVVANAYFVKVKGKWSAVWLQDNYNSLVAGKCNTSTTARGLY